MEQSRTGSDVWTCATEYEGEYKARVDYVIETIDRQALCNFSAGSFNLVIKVTFQDGVNWIVRLRMPPIEKFNLHETGWEEYRHLGDSTRTRYEMQSELDTMEFLRLNTDIPIPQVHGYDLDERNAVGFSFIVMDYIHGMTAEELSKSLPGNHEGIPLKYQNKFWSQIASIMSKLANIRFSRSGSIIRNDTGTFQIEKFVDTWTGPYTSIRHFVEGYPQSLKTSIYKPADGDIGQDALLQMLNGLAILFDDLPTDETFGLANCDLGPNNVIVDHEFNILSIIDWDSVVAVPDPALYRFPFLMGMEPPRPGIPSKDPHTLKREELARAFAQIVEQVSQEESRSDTSGNRRPFCFTKTGFFSKEANFFRSLVFLRFKQTHVNGQWTKVLRHLQSDE